mmetsp:Transcript_11883/g.20070  ORF Transcript_11883/g.20070 Transcript_11883/m.20070 type:complete len:119 (+) Transcript_11883:165-521(+)|eukprot:CAMPEP_0198211410 /NCGR_PEP_ID=MMETSP1445-20131203/23735_1 /TAXON_ID=36898 /ORGANISM="Pyramimonas sp., Strain CCMP2087" /LENGTH=118 /DNA_ID=CAMNT_0043885667 /DNA_START=147 /DNA_END=503 /DNA_ORIENTATION=+
MTRSNKKKATTPPVNGVNGTSLEEIDQIVAEVQAEADAEESGKTKEQPVVTKVSSQKPEKHDAKTKYLAGLIKQVQSDVTHLRLASGQDNTSIAIAAISGVAFGAAMASIFCLKSIKN